MFKFIRIGNTNLVCYENGTILRFGKQTKKWSVCNGTKDKDGYLTMRIDNKFCKCHRIIAHAFKILDLHDSLQIDHIDINKSNNCIKNLRPSTQQQNSFNTNAKGYCWHKNINKWQSRIMVNGESIHLGYFDKEEDAKQAYLNAKEIYHKF
jgi:hypothetical protein